MKRIITTIAACFLLFSLNAQIETRTLRVGANLYGNFSNITSPSTNEKYSIIELNTVVSPGFYIGKNFELGLDIGYSEYFEDYEGRGIYYTSKTG